MSERSSDLFDKAVSAVRSSRSFTDSQMVDLVEVISLIEQAVEAAIEDEAEGK